MSVRRSRGTWKLERKKEGKKEGKKKRKKEKRRKGKKKESKKEGKKIPREINTDITKMSCHASCLSNIYIVTCTPLDSTNAQRVSIQAAGLGKYTVRND